MKEKPKTPYARLSEWISVKDRLPEQWDCYLVALGGKYVHLTEFDPYEYREKWSIGSSVTHWMPLPQPPEQS